MSNKHVLCFLIKTTETNDFFPFTKQFLLPTQLVYVKISVLIL